MPSSSSARDELARNCCAAAVAGGVQASVFNPLDCLRIRWQVAGSGAAPSMLSFVHSIARSDGLLRGLYLPGIEWNVLAVASSQGVRLGLYPSVRGLLVPEGAVRPDLLALSGFLSGSLAYFVTAPVWLLKTRGQAAAQLGHAAPLPTTVPGFWLGCTPLVLRGALLTSGHLAGYDGTKQLGRSRGLSDGPLLHVLAAITAAFAAATLAAPADALQTRVQSAAAGEQSTLLGSAAALVRAEGAMGLMRGWGVNVARLVPTFIVGATIYEQARRGLGLGYLK